MNLDKMKPDLKSLNLEKLKREMSEHMPRVRVKMTPRRWIALVAGLAVVGGALYLWLRPRPVPVVLPVWPSSR